MKACARIVAALVALEAVLGDTEAGIPLGVPELLKLAHATVKSETTDAQANVNAAFSRLQEAADLVSKTKSQADTKDLELLACREREKEQAAARHHINALSDEINVECKARDEMQIFDWAVPSDVAVQGTCDFSKSGLQGCGDFGKLKAAVDAFQATFANDQKAYPGKAKQCKSMLFEVGDFLAGKGEQNFLKIRTECEQLQQEADFAMCAFGNRLNERCAAKQEFDKVVEAYEQVGALGGNSTALGLAAFAFGLDLKPEALEELNLDTFFCNESSIQFSGYRWDTSQYVKESFVLDFVPGKPFGLCFPTNCKGTWGEWSECVGECGTATTTRHFTITAPARNGGYCPRGPETKFCNRCQTDSATS